MTLFMAHALWLNHWFVEFMSMTNPFRALVDLSRGRARRAETMAEAERMIARYRSNAYGEARDRAAGRCLDGGRPRHYWTRVKLEIARRQDIAPGLGGADLWA